MDCKKARIGKKQCPFWKVKIQMKDDFEKSPDSLKVNTGFGNTLKICLVIKLDKETYLLYKTMSGSQMRSHGIRILSIPL